VRREKREREEGEIKREERDKERERRERERHRIHWSREGGLHPFAAAAPRGAATLR
jgi:hypothetical protein